MDIPANIARAGRWAIVGLLVACANEPDPGSDDASDDPCVPGQSIACECDDGSPGARVCEPDGIGFAACVCEGEDDDGASAEVGSEGASDDAPADDDAADDSDPTDAGDTFDPTDGETGSDTEAAVPTFQNDIVPILYEACGAGDTLCHARNAYFAAVDQGCRGWMSFEDAPLGAVFDDLDPNTDMPSEGPTGCPDLSLYDRLLQLAPWECDASSSYIEPGSLEESYMFVKLSNGITCGDFRLMPPPGEGYVLTQAQYDAFRDWILAGAPQ